nr:amino-acid transporter arg-13 [Quercus suber]
MYSPLRRSRTPSYVSRVRAGSNYAWSLALQKLSDNSHGETPSRAISVSHVGTRTHSHPVSDAPLPPPNDRHKQQRPGEDAAADGEHVSLQHRPYHLRVVPHKRHQHRGTGGKAKVTPLTSASRHAGGFWGGTICTSHFYSSDLVVCAALTYTTNRLHSRSTIMDVKTSSRTFGSPSTTTVMAESVQIATEKAAEGWKDIVFGSIAGTVGKVVEYPFDTVKVRLQSQPDHLPLRYKGPIDCFRQSFQQGGVRGLYNGVSAPLAGAALETASLFYTYNVSREVLRSTFYPTMRDADALPLYVKASAGAISGGCTSLILTPIELVKCRMQAPLQSIVDPTLARSGVTPTQLSPFTVIADIFRREGLKGFWRGQLGTFLRETGGSAAWFGGYEATSSYCKRRLSKIQNKSVRDVELPVAQSMASGAIAGMSYNFLFFPADTIKSKIQTGELTSVRPTFVSVGKELYRVHGLKGLYRGCGITVARSAPSSALIFTIMEYLKKTFA